MLEDEMYIENKRKRERLQIIIKRGLEENPSKCG